MNASSHEPPSPPDAPTRSDRQLWLITRSGKRRRSRIARVALALRQYRLYSYGVPEALAGLLRPGMLVRVPWGRADRPVTGWVVDISDEPLEHTRKDILEAIGTGPPIPPALVELAVWLAEYYGCTPAQGFEVVVPTIVRQALGATQRWLEKAPVEPPARLSQAQRCVLSALEAGPLPGNTLLARTSVSRAVIRRLVQRGLLVESERPVEFGAEVPTPSDLPHTPEDDFELTGAQQAALRRVIAAIDAGRLHVPVLFGPPASGKTEVYVRAMQHVVRQGRQAIILVPEIALATQIVERLARRFSRVAVLHSQLTGRARREAHEAIFSGAVQVVIGTRAAVFAPTRRLGLIVVDEEQDSSYKSLSMPYYHARDVAVRRGQIERVPVVLGSATPAIETWFNVQHLPHYELVRLRERVPGAAAPRVQVVEPRPAAPGQPPPLISRELADALRRVLDAGDQAIILHNRRGYATHLRCTACGLLLRCHRCGALLVYHRSERRLKCHRCGTRHAVQTRCPDNSCGGVLKPGAPAIQKLEDELRRQFPRARLLRLDRDTMRRRSDYEDALRRFEAHEADVLIGTQMVAKGLDFPRVRLVGVVEADAALHRPDFRAAEQVFQLIAQVVGRAGRRAGQSLAIVQAEQAREGVVAHAIAGDYEAFARDELPAREALRTPPYWRLVRFVCGDPDGGRARRAAEALCEGLREVAGRIHARIVVEDAEPCLVARLRELLRWQVLLRLPRDISPAKLLRAAVDAKLLSTRCKRLVIDVDPMDLS